MKAYRVAESALADKLGEDAKAFHCLGGHASIVSDSPDGEWRFVFYSKKGDVREVVVFYDAKTTVIRESIETEF